MTVEEAKKTTAPADEHESKAVPRVSAADDNSSSSGSFDGHRATSKPIDCAFDTTEDPRYYKPIPEYEGYHRWDPDFEWTEEEEKAVVRKVRKCRELVYIIV